MGTYLNVKQMRNRFNYLKMLLHLYYDKEALVKTFIIMQNILSFRFSNVVCVINYLLWNSLKNQKTYT